jgi:hypothetical protein
MTRRGALAGKFALPEPRTKTAEHMADALTFLVRVAGEAGMAGIAHSLSAVRERLNDVATNEAPGAKACGGVNHRED